ncbi:CCA tRNA nucleotidyltransferase [Pseudochelatococcus sp. G4_1912]|uniref:CCA tRNA nucleotidyltransferase n=1 Tax=Pseudochelatococcus sp. G4_1912 TaxID=3114288 RepID=UPI0039C5F99F
MMNEVRAQKLLDDPVLRHVLTVIDAQGADTRIVGGAVRNVLMGLPANDIDCATTATPQEVAELARAAGLKVVPTGIDHGTVTVVAHGRPFEITTLRRDVATNGRRAEVAFGTDFDIDAHRRDFTMNALYLDKHGKLYDFTNGLADITARRVRFIGDAATRIREDYLRILRFFRFSADYGVGALDAAGLAACIQERAGLAQLSRERVRSEMLRILVARRAVEVVTDLSDIGVLTAITGGVAELGRFTRVASGADDAVIRLLALSVVVPEDAERLRERLRLSNGEFDRLNKAGSLIARMHGRRETVDVRTLRRLVVELGLQPVADATTVLAGEPTPVLNDAAHALLADFINGSQRVPVFPLTGKHLAAAGVSAGPRMGRVLARARDLWLDADCSSNADDLNALLAKAVIQVP